MMQSLVFVLLLLLMVLLLLLLLVSRHRSNSMWSSDDDDDYDDDDDDVDVDDGAAHCVGDSENNSNTRYTAKMFTSLAKTFLDGQRTISAIRFQL